MSVAPQLGEGGFEIRIEQNLDRISREWWQRLDPPSIYLTYDWLRARSSMVGGLPRFVLVSDRSGAPILALPCYLTSETSHPGYDVARLLLMEDFDESAVEAWPDTAVALDRLRAGISSRLACLRPGIVAGAPGLMGGVSYAPGLSDAARREALGAAVTAMERRARLDGAAAICWLYVPEGEDEGLDVVLRDREYRHIVMGADCYLPLPWASLDDYVASLPGSRRRKVRREISAAEAAEVEFQTCGAEMLGPELAPLELQWRHKYGRSATMEGTLAGYDELRGHVGDRILVFVARLAGRAIGFTCFLDDGETWWARFGGFDYASGPLYLYFNLTFYHPIRAAIARGVRTISYSRSAYETKRSRGCLLRNFGAYLKSPRIGDALPDLLAISAAQRRRFAHIASKS